MICPTCEKEVIADRLFCTWCESYVPRVGVGTKSGFFRRWSATVIDPILLAGAFVLPPLVLGSIAGETMGMLVATITLLAVIVWSFRLFTQGMTPGKLLLGEKVVSRTTGMNPGFGKMFLREVIGKFISTFFFGLGFFWAIWDKDGQAWHDKIAGTLVVQRRARPVLVPSAQPLPRSAVPAP